MTKWIIVTGGVLSGIGKGTATASIGRLLSSNLKVVPVKCDGYLNIDPGTMNPFEHGEVFVLDDGGEVDMDFGHYERFLNVNCTSKQNLTTGKVFDYVIKKERKGDYLGHTVQIIPHVTNEIKRRFFDIAKTENADIVIIEIGGTVGDIENSWFVEAVRQLKKDVGHENILYVHLSYVPYLKSVGQQKTKPVQKDVERLRERGIFPDIIIARSEQMLADEAKKKISLFCDVDEEAVISGVDIETIYEVPLIYEQQGMLKYIQNRFKLEHKEDLKEWKSLVERIKNPSKKIKVAICGKYTALGDSYASLKEALIHAGATNDCGLEIDFLDAEKFETKSPNADLNKYDGIIVPIGFGERGAEGKIKAIQFARENNIPYLGLCFGLQLAVIEFARNVCKLAGANTTENEPATKYPVVDILPEQKTVTEKGGTMRLGLYEAHLVKGSIVEKLHHDSKVSERHRHRFEVNPLFHDELKKHGMVISGTSENGRLAEYIELPKHKFFVATQAHPEYRSRLEKPSPLFLGFVKACANIK